MRIIFMGTPDFSADTMDALLAAGHQVCLAVTQPDKPKGRGRKMQFSPVKERALAHEIPVYQPERIKRPECATYLEGYQADIIVVVAFGQIIPKSILELCPFGCVNVHASLLPKYRGAAPIQWAILEGERKTGVTTMQMNEGLDTGDMLLMREIDIAPRETADSLRRKLAQVGAELCVETLAKLQTGDLKATPQPESPTAYASMLTKQMGELCWDRPAVVLERQIRAMDSWPGTYTLWGDKMLKIWAADVEEADMSAPVGTVVSVGKDSFRVQTGDGLLVVKEVQLPGKQRMAAGAFLRGNGLQVHEVLGAEHE